MLGGDAWIRRRIRWVSSVLLVWVFRMRISTSSKTRSFRVVSTVEGYHSVLVSQRHGLLISGAQGSEAVYGKLKFALTMWGGQPNLLATPHCWQRIRQRWWVGFDLELPTLSGLQTQNTMVNLDSFQLLLLHGITWYPCSVRLSADVEENESSPASSTPARLSTSTPSTRSETAPYPSYEVVRDVSDFLFELNSTII